MDHSEADRLFRRFQATHDPAAIAAVYDGLAPELLLIAAHLGHRSGDAEDLVQETFLAALESAGRFDAERRLVPWLIGILVNQARRQHRRRNRSPDPTRLPTIPEVDPAIAAEDGEFREELARQLRALPTNYRLSLTLRWVHGLSPIEIAHATGEPPATVRTRLRRGQEILRQTLPAGFAAAAFLVSGASALAAGRAAVVRRAEEIAAAASTAGVSTDSVPATIGAPAPALLGVCLAVVGLIVAGVWWTRPPVDEAGAHPPSVASFPAPTATTPNGTAAEVRAVVESEVEREAPPIGELHLEVRYSDGTPAGAVGIGVRRRHAADPLMTERWVVTDAAGAAVARGLEPGEYELIGDRAGSWAAVMNATEGRRAVLSLPEGVTLSGSILGSNGTPLAGARVWISGAEQPDEGRSVAVSDSAGRFEVRAIATGRSLGVFANGFVPRPLERLDGAPGTTVERVIDLSELASPFRLTGRVVDAAGRPSPDVRVQIGRRLAYLDFDQPARGPLERSPPIEVRSDEQGRFEVEGLVPFEGAVDLWARAPAGAATRATASFSEGTDANVPGATAEVVITLPLSRKLVGTCGTATGSVVAGAQVVVRSPALGAVYEAPRWAQPTGWSDGEGRFVIDGIPCDDVVATARAPNGAEETRPIAAGTEDARWDATLRERRPLSGVVRTDDGAPLADVMVRALVPPGHVEPKPALTDATGAFRLEETLQTTYDVWVADPASAWNGALLTRAAVRPDQSPLSLVVERLRRSNAAIVGRVLDRRGLPVAARVRLGNLHVGGAFAATDEAGRFGLGPIPALDAAYDLVVRSEHGEELHHGSIVVRPHSTVDVGDLVLEPPGHARLRLVDIEHRLLDAVPEDLAIVVSTDDGFGRHISSPGAAGPAPLALPPGAYALHLRGDGLPLAPTRFDVVSERTTDVDVVVQEAHPRTFRVRHADDGWDLRLDLEWCAADGSFLARDRVQWSHDRPLVTTRSFASGAYRLRMRSHAGRHAEVRFEVPAPADAAPVLIDLE